VNPRANGSAEAMLPVGTDRIVASQSVKRHDFLGLIFIFTTMSKPLIQ